MAIAYLDVSAEIFLELCKGLKAGEQPRYFRVVKNPLPDDAELVRASFAPYGAIRLFVSSPSFQNYQQLEPPTLEIVYQEPSA